MTLRVVSQRQAYQSSLICNGWIDLEEDKEGSLADIPWIEETLTQPWVRFEAQICQDEVQHWATMFTWFRAMHLQWEENQRKRGDE